MPHSTEDKNALRLEEVKDRTLYKIRMFCSSETELGVAPEEGHQYLPGELVVMDTRYGKDVVRVTGIVVNRDGIGNEKIKPIIRRANSEDRKKMESMEEKTPEAFALCKEKIEKHKLEMKLVAAHYLVDEPKIIFFFTADNRIDFRELVKDLVADFRLRIELRQIGVRDEARVMGGLAVCGRDYCCHSITDRLVPVSIKMAKEQSLSLNSLKISGPCGRLLCCLSYEQEYYQKERGKYPPEGARFRYQRIDLKVSELNIFKRSVVLSGPNGRLAEIPRESFSYNKARKEWQLDDTSILDEDYGDESDHLSK